MYPAYVYMGNVQIGFVVSLPYQMSKIRSSLCCNRFIGNMLQMWYIGGHIVVPVILQ